MRFTKKEINKLINLRGCGEELLDIFNLLGYLSLLECGTSKLNKFCSHTLPILYSDFEWCKTEENVRDQFNDSLLTAIREKLLQ